MNGNESTENTVTQWRVVYKLHNSDIKIERASWGNKYAQLYAIWARSVKAKQTLVTWIFKTNVLLYLLSPWPFLQNGLLCGGRLLLRLHFLLLPLLPSLRSRRLPSQYRSKAATSPAEQQARSPHPLQLRIRFHDGGACGKRTSSTPDFSVTPCLLLLLPCLRLLLLLHPLLLQVQTRRDWRRPASKSVAPVRRFLHFLRWCSFSWFWSNEPTDVRLHTWARVTDTAALMKRRFFTERVYCVTTSWNKQQEKRRVDDS